MIKKLLKVLGLLYVCYLLVCIVVSCSTPPVTEEQPLLTWDRSVSKMLDYEIDGDRITIRYSVRIVNNYPDVDLELSNFTLYSSPEEVSGWFKYQDYYTCALESGDYSVIIPRGESVDLVLILESTRFDREVPQDPPEFHKLRYMLSVVG